jgi:hypothetical protein
MLTFLQSFNSGGNIQEEDLSVYLKNTELGHVAFPDIFDAAGYLRPETVDMLKWEEDWRPGPVIPASPFLLFVNETFFFINVNMIVKLQYKY